MPCPLPEAPCLLILDLASSGHRSGVAGFGGSEGGEPPQGLPVDTDVVLGAPLPQEETTWATLYLTNFC